MRDYNGNDIEVPPEFAAYREHLDIFQKGQLASLRRFAATCDRLGLRYYLASGGALGAARHGGFIPWDDDVDIVMPRPDYDKLEELLIRGETDLRCYSFMDNPDFVCTFLKVAPKEVENLYRSPYAIDVFPLDILPRSKLLRIFQEKFRVFLQQLLNCRYGCHVAKTPRWKFCFYRFVGFFFPRDTMKINRIRRSLLRTPGEFTADAIVGGRFSMYGEKEFMPFEIYGVNGGADLEFCGEKFKAPARLERYLTHFFGDWRGLPPLEKRLPHHVEDPNWFWSGSRPMSEQKLMDKNV